jgi:hypothetical protein
LFEEFKAVVSLAPATYHYIVVLADPEERTSKAELSTGEAIPDTSNGGNSKLCDRLSRSVSFEYLHRAANRTIVV